MSDDVWAALCAFAKNPQLQGDPREPWEIVTTRKPKPKTRKRKMTLARALRQADKAGVAVSSATITANGVELQMGETAVETANEGDSVQ